MSEQVVRLGPVNDWVRTAAHHLHADVVPVSGDLDERLPADGAVLLSCDVPGLNVALTRLLRRDQLTTVTVGWIPDPDRGSRALAAALGLPRRPTEAATVARDGAVRHVRVVRDDHGGLLLLRGTLGAAHGRRFGAQSWHDDQRVADGEVRRIEVRPDYTADCAVTVVVGRRRTSGRSVQTACAEATAAVDGVTHPRAVTRWTWYADPRQRWLLRTPERPA